MKGKPALTLPLHSVISPRTSSALLGSLIFLRDSFGGNPIPTRRARAFEHRCPIRPEKCREEDVSTEQAGSQAPPRLPCAHGDQERPQGHRRSPRPWPQAPVGVSAVKDSPMRDHRAASSLGRLTKRPDFVAA